MTGAPRIAVLGAGHVGPVIARVAIEAGYPVSIAASGDPEEIALIAQVLAPGAEPRWAADAVEDADIVVLAIPLHRFPAFDPGLVAGKLVVDTMNYWPPVDGVQDDVRGPPARQQRDRRASGSPGSTVVKTLNHIGYHELDDERRPAGSPDRRALGVAGDDPAAVDVVADVDRAHRLRPVRLDGLRGGPSPRARRPGVRRGAEPCPSSSGGRAEPPGRRHQRRETMIARRDRQPFPLVFGLDTFGDVTDDADGRPLSHAQTIRNVVEQGVLADQVGMDFFGIGEHHTDDFPLSAADVVLAAIAARTTRIRLGSAVTVLSSDDPVRVFQRYSTLNAISGGRAEVILGRGSSIDSFPLFGYDLADYEDLFEEKTNLFAELLKGGPVTWEGKTRAALHDQDVVPHIESGPFPAWIGVGGSPQSVDPRRALRVLADARDHRRARRRGSRRSPSSSGRPCAKFGRAAAAGRGALARPRRRDRRAGREEFWPHYLEVITPRQQGSADSRSRPRSRSPHEIGPHGALYVGSPETVAPEDRREPDALSAPPAST